MAEKSPGSLPEDRLMAEIKERLRKQIKQELLEEIYQELKREEKEPLNTKSVPKDPKKEAIAPGFQPVPPQSSPGSVTNQSKTVGIQAQTIVESPASSASSAQAVSGAAPKIREEININTKAVLKIASHAIKYANKMIPRDKWVEVIGLLAGKIEGDALFIEDAYPMGHGNAIHAEVKDYKNYARAFTDLRKQDLFICGWYHSHPTFGLFLSTEDLGTQSRYQKLWDKSVALVLDPYMIDGTSYGFEIYRADRTHYFPIPYKMKGTLSVKELPDLLEFINPIVDGKALFLEYDE